jgi:tetratricopeptide (TPR) repeat protein
MPRNHRPLTSRFALIFAAACVVAWLAGRTASHAQPPQPEAKPASAAPTFNKHVAPIMFEYCASCHHAGGAGPFSLTTYQDAKKRAKQIAAVTASRYMPPWLPDDLPAPHTFVGARRLSDEQIKLLQQWADAGALEGDAADLPAAPKFNAGWQLGQPDLIVKMPQAYTLAASGTDVFRNFVIPVPVTATRYVRAVEILPGNKQVVHHANILIDRSQTSRRKDAEDAEPGFAGMDVAMEADSFEPDSHFLFWKPGSVPQSEPDGMAWRLEPGTDLVLNMHMQPSGKPEQIQPSVGLYFTDQPPTKFPMLLQLERDGALDIPPGKKDFVVTDEFTLPVDVDVLGVYPHAHYLGRDVRAYAVLPGGRQQPLIRIRNWDLNWQAVYMYAQPVFLPKGSTVVMRYVYDNSAENVRNPHRPPKRVTAGNRSSDEMAHLWLQVLPRTVEDSRAALQEALMRQRLRKYPADFTAHFNLGAVLQAGEKHAEAVTHFTQALKTEPRNVTALTSLAVSLQATGKVEEAMSYYRQAVQIKPDYSHAHYNLGNLLLAQGKLDEGIEHLRQVLGAKPDDAGALNSLGSAYAMKGNWTEAAKYFVQAVRVNPANADAHYNLGYVLAFMGQIEQAIIHYEKSLRLKPDNADGHNELGILYAQRGRMREAAARFEQALKVNPQHGGARENLRRAREQMK